MPISETGRRRSQVTQRKAPLATAEVEAADAALWFTLAEQLYAWKAILALFYHSLQ